VHGKNYFVGCSKWQQGETFQHLYAPIPAQVDETVLFQLVNNTRIDCDDVGQYELLCSAFRHPRHGKQKKCSQ